MVEQKQFLYNQQQCILKVMICTGEDDPLGYLLAEQLLMRASPQYQQNPFAEALETNISPFAKCIHVGLLVHPNHVENENLKSLVQRFQSTNLLSTVIGDALEEKPEELSKKLDHYQVIVSASLRNSILHPHTQYRTEMNLIDTCIYMSRQTYGCFKAFVPCQFMFDFTKFKEIDWNLQMGNQTFIWSFIQQKQLVLQKLREHSIPYMAIHCGLCTDLLVEFITYSDARSVNQQQQSIQLYLDCDFSDVNVDCTTIKDVAQITADKISKIGTDVPFSTQEWSFSGDRINLKQISESLNWQLIRLGSLQDCQLKINQLVQQIQQNDNHGLDTEKYRLSAFLTKYLIGKNCALLSEMTPKTKLVEKGFQFENCVNFTKQLYTPLQYTSQQGFY